MKETGSAIEFGWATGSEFGFDLESALETESDSVSDLPSGYYWEFDSAFAMQ